MMKVNAAEKQLQIEDERFEKPLLFTVNLPDGYEQNADKRYALLFDFHPYADSYLKGMHDWLSHNGEWPWPQTIIVNPAMGNPVGRLFDASGKTTPLIDFFEAKLLPALDKNYRTNGFRIMSGFRVNGTLALSAMLRKPGLFNAYFVTSPELEDDYAGILSAAASGMKTIDAPPVYVLITHGSGVKEKHQLDEYARLNQILSDNLPPNVAWDYRDFSEHMFMTLPLLTLLTGIEQVFGKEQVK
ncbi:hypothetical protein LJ739_11240 [Aestuariibacter halophilus]|uniref:Esterase n=1 Tax=Fluctibacter halophilus TaxID=226011 RepID=A0ABS8GC83_9ALTE|nr:hypothetical protein [Aestuariibacter halophilus]